MIIMNPIYKRLSGLYMFVFFGIPVLAFGCNHDSPLPIDAKATQETRSLHAFLHRLQGERILFGHQDDLAYGVHWRYQSGKSDVKDVAGDYPAVMGWDIGGIEYGHEVNLDAVPFDL